ncbi:hypothetical protein F8M41_017372 [Gigaspora margarita]|uniref:Uncharacterized protein n=1 Tax=Gigaspora margarita TaxID=4874 RepID=A0A8H3WUV6_GIGMA|nr:hypothetical protein F8M41_017372 [Gigaspora margarita]
MSSDNITNNFKENLDKIPTLNLEINSLKSDILELFDQIIERLENSTNNTSKLNNELEDLYNQIEWKQIILDNTIAEFTDFINIDSIERDKYLEETYDLTSQIIKYILELKRRKRRPSDPKTNPNPNPNPTINQFLTQKEPVFNPKMNHF